MLLPTIAALAGVGSDQFKTDGIDLGPLLFDGQSLPDRTLFWRARSQAAVRSGPWKLYRNGKRTELYNLNDDLGEQRDLADEQPDLVQRRKGCGSRRPTLAVPCVPPLVPC